MVYKSFLHCSRFILVPILTEWLLIQDVGRLDSACNNEGKQLLLLLYKDFPILFGKLLPCEETGISFAMISWRVYRGLYQWQHSVLITEQFLLNISSQFSTVNWFLDLFLPSKNIILENGFQYVKSIRIGDCSSSVVSTLCAVLKMCLSLEEITFGLMEDQNKVISTLANYCPHLQKIAAECILRIDDCVLQHLVSKCPLLREIYCVGMPKSRSIEYLQQCNSLQVFSTAKQSRFQSTMHVTKSNRVLESSLFSFVLYRGDGLLQLDLTNQGILSDACYLYIAQHCPNLRKLYLPMATISLEVFSNTFLGLPHLTAVGVDLSIDSSEIALPKLAASCPNIAELKLRYAYSIGTLFPNLQSLEYLRIVTAAELESIVAKCPNLTRLDAAIGTRSDALGGVCEAVNAKNLLSFRLWSELNYSQLDLDLLAGLTKLTELDIRFPVSGELVLSMLRGCPGLKLLFIDIGSAAEYHEFISFAELCKNLHGLGLTSYNSTLDASVITEIVKSGKQLRKLKIAAKLDKASIPALQSRLEKLNPRAIITVFSYYN